MDKVIIKTFTDPMMGLSYECEPIFRKLETHFEGNIEFQYIMSGLVKNVYDFVDKQDLTIGRDYAIKKYNKKLAKIYESEETISNMPINMTDFHLFSTENTSSIPLNLAYKSVQIFAKDKADLFLYNLRYATIVDCKQTTQLNEILKVVDKTGINKDEFLKYYNDGTAENEFKKDLMLCRKLEIYTLPAYLIQYQDKAILIKSLIGYDSFVSAIKEITNSKIIPKKIMQSLENLRKLLNIHPLISPIEIKEAFDFDNIDEVKEFIKPLFENTEIEIIQVHNGWFIKRI